MKRRNGLTVKRDRALLSMCIPGIVKLIVFAYLPMIGIIIAFQDYSPKKGLFSPFVGLSNFEFFFSSGQAFRIIGITIVMNALFIVVGLIVCVGLALLMNEIRSRKYLKLAQSTMFIPYFISWLLVGYIGTALLDSRGVVTQLISLVTGQKDLDFYMSSDHWWLILLLANLWKNAGVSAIIYYACILNIDGGIYEAAALDGAGRWHCVRHIVLPALAPTVTVMTVMNIGNIVRSDFGLFFFVTRNSGPVMKVYETIDTYVFKMTIASNSSDAIVQAAAAGLIQSLVGFVLILVTNTIVRRINDRAALF